jgi:hypothetical protein
VVAAAGGLRRRERPLHAAFRRPFIQPKRPDKMMAGAADPSAAACGARSALSAPQQAGRVPVDARGVGSKPVDDREKPRPREMPVVGRAGLGLASC